MRSVLTALCLFASTAHAVPAQFTHQGRLLDADGAPLEDEATITFRVIDSETGGTALWEDDITVLLTNGFYSAVLGADEDNPLDTDVLSQAPVWLELQLEGEGTMFPRSPINAVPYATMATVAEEVSGGPVDASEVAVDGSVVINEDGSWVGPTPSIGWDDIEDKPDGIEDDVDTVLSAEEVRAIVGGSTLDLGAGSTMSGSPLATTDDLVTPSWESLERIPDDFADGVDDDALTDLAISCVDGDVPHWSEVLLSWSCSEDLDTVLSSDEVEGYITDGALDLASGTTLGGSDISTGAHTSSLDWGDLTGVPDGFSDGTDDDTQLSGSDVEGFITDGAIDLASGTTLGGATISTGAHTGSSGMGALVAANIYRRTEYYAEYSSLFSARCDGDDIAIGGGCQHASSSSHYLTASYPSPFGWNCSWGSTRYVYVYVICLDVD